MICKVAKKILYITTFVLTAPAFCTDTPAPVLSECAANLIKSFVAQKVAEQIVSDSGPVKKNMAKQCVAYGLYETDSRLAGKKPSWRQKGKKILSLATSFTGFCLGKYLCSKTKIDTKILSAQTLLKKICWKGAKMILQESAGIIVRDAVGVTIDLTSKVFLTPSKKKKEKKNHSFLTNVLHFTGKLLTGSVKVAPPTGGDMSYERYIELANQKYPTTSV